MNKENTVDTRLLDRIGERVKNVNVSDGYIIQKAAHELEKMRLEIACLEGQLLRAQNQGGAHELG